MGWLVNRDSVAKVMNYIELTSSMPEGEPKIKPATPSHRPG